MSAQIERAGMRISNREREQAVRHLQECTRDGRLELDEFTTRVDAVYSAKTFGELSPLLADLPAIGAPAGVEELSPTAASINRGGRWSVPRRLVVRSDMSGVGLDLSSAQIGFPQLDIELDARDSGITIVLPEDGWATEELDLHASRMTNHAAAQTGRGGVKVRVTGTLSLSGLKIRRRHRFLWWTF